MQTGDNRNNIGLSGQKLVRSIEREGKEYEKTYIYRPNFEDKGLMLFLSYDICDSTKMKTHGKWMQVVDLLYEATFNSMKLWKTNGDEVLYVENIKDMPKLMSLIVDAYNYMLTLQGGMSEIIPGVFLQGTMWLARIEPGLDAEHNIKLIGVENDEFLGQNIDEGFRLAKNTTKSVMTLDPKIVFLLYEYCNSKTEKCLVESFGQDLDIGNHDTIERLLSHIHFLGYTKCKGVWKERDYPIYWYIPDTQTVLQYDEKFKGVYVEELIEAEKPLNKIRNIVLSVGLKDELKYFEEVLSDAKNSQSIRRAYTSSKLYYTVACCSPFSGKIFVAKRSGIRRHLKNVWDFGNCRHSSLDTEETILQTYRNDFGVDIALEKDFERGGSIIPFAFCNTHRFGKPQNSLLCYATIIVEDPNILDDNSLLKYIKEKAAKKKYVDFLFLGAEEAKKFKCITFQDVEKDSIQAIKNENKAFPEQMGIMYFGKTIEAAMKYFSEKKQK